MTSVAEPPFNDQPRTLPPKSIPKSFRPTFSFNSVINGVPRAQSAPASCTRRIHQRLREVRDEADRGRRGRASAGCPRRTRPAVRWENCTRSDRHLPHNRNLPRSFIKQTARNLKVATLDFKHSGKTAFWCSKRTTVGVVTVMEGDGRSRADSATTRRGSLDGFCGHTRFSRVLTPTALSEEPGQRSCDGSRSMHHHLTILTFKLHITFVNFYALSTPHQPSSSLFSPIRRCHARWI